MFIFHNFHKIYFIFSFIILFSCKLQEPKNTHGIIYLENRSSQINVNKNNKNDVIRIIGYPHTKSISNGDNWVYIERIFTKGEFHKLGQNVLKTNNVLVLTFDKYGIVKDKQFLKKEDINNLKFSKEITKNSLTKKSFIEDFLSSVKAKMYSNRK